MGLYFMPFPLWNDDLFYHIGLELGRLIEVSPTIIDKSNLLEAWIKVHINDLSLIPSEIDIFSPIGIFTVQLQAFNSSEAPLRAITRSIAHVVSSVGSYISGSSSLRTKSIQERTAHNPIQHTSAYIPLFWWFTSVSN